jgi:hypothetical protein
MEQSTTPHPMVVTLIVTGGLAILLTILILAATTAGIL